MSEDDYLHKIEAFYLKTKKVHGNTIKVLLGVATIISAFGIMVINQGFQTARETSKVVETQTLMYQVMDGRINDLDQRIDGVKDFTLEQRAELQRQLDLIMRDRKLVDRGASLNNTKSKPIPTPK